MESFDSKEGPPSEQLRWYLLVNNFDFDVRNKGKLGDVGDLIDKSATHLLFDPEPS